MITVGFVTLMLLSAQTGAGDTKADRPPLLADAWIVQCGDESAAREAIARLARAPLPLGVPDEALTAGPGARVDAASIDLTLDALNRGRKRHPALRLGIEGLVRSWRMEHVTDGVEAWDLRLGRGVTRSRPLTPLPLSGRGFRAWGIWPSNGSAEDAESTAAFAAQMGRAVVPVPPPLSAGEPPHADAPAGDSTCDGSAGATLFDHQPRMHSGPLRIPLDGETRALRAAPVRITIIGSRVTGPRPELAARHETVRPPVVLPPPQSELAVQPVENRTGLKIGGSLSNTQRLTGPASQGLTVSRAVGQRTSLRVGMSYGYFDGLRFRVPANRLSWAWGIASEFGPFSLQLNHWGPLRFERSLEFIEGAILSLSYRLPLPTWANQYFGASLQVTQALKTAPPAIAASVAIKLFWRLSAFAGLRRPLWQDGGEYSWSYGFGYSDYRPFAFSFNYANWGPNLLNQANFVANGSFTLSLGWAF